MSTSNPKQLELIKTRKELLAVLKHIDDTMEPLKLVRLKVEKELDELVKTCDHTDGEGNGVMSGYMYYTCPYCPYTA